MPTTKNKQSTATYKTNQMQTNNKITQQQQNKQQLKPTYQTANLHSKATIHNASHQYQQHHTQTIPTPKLHNQTHLKSNP